MFITGISDEAGKDLATQIRAHQELGWDKMELRVVSVDGGLAKNVHTISDAMENDWGKSCVKRISSLPQQWRKI